MTGTLDHEAGARAPAHIQAGGVLLVVAWLARLALGLILLVAALLKIPDPALFAEQIRAYEVLPPALAPAAARFFLVVEMGLALALISGWKPRLALPAAGALLVLFMSAIAWAWAHGYSGPCGCFGSHGARGPGGALLEDTVFLALAVAGYVGLRGRPGDRPWQRGVALGGLVLGVALPVIAERLPIDSLVTGARPGGHFDHVVVEGFGGDIEEGRYLVALLDPESERTAELAARLDLLAAEDELPQVVAVFQGTGDDVVAYMFAHDPSFELGHAPQAALRRFYRRLPVFLDIEDGVIRRAWHGELPAASELRTTG